MDLEVVGRHALLFDDDATAAFTNSSDALVEWNGLSIDRYDVRHLLPSPPPPRKPRRQYTEDPSLGSELDHERYLDLPPPGEDEQELDLHEGPKPVDTGGYRAVSFSYGKSNESIEENNNDADSGFRPPFQVPESLLQNLPPTEKLHQIIARTAVFVSKHGGQSEIVLRVKQGDNPTFGFLMPDHHLHAYFRFLVDHQELFEPDGGSKSLEEKNIANSGPDHSGGALSILGSIYGSGEDEEGTTKDVPDSEEAADVGNANVSNGSGQAEPYVNAAGKDEVVAKSSFSVMKEKAPIIKRNRFISTVGNTVGNKNEGDALNALSTAGNKSQTSLPRTSKVEGPIVEPPSDLKRVVDKIVEFILRNGKEFEAVLVEQDKKHGRFPFLLPSNQYHAYYLEVLKKVKESKLPGKASVSEKHDSVGHGVDKKTASKEGDTLSGGSASHDIPYNYDKKEKFKMVLGKSKKDGQDLPSKATEPQIDAAAAAAILQAATRGINNVGLEFFPRTSLNGSSRGPSIEGGRTSSFGSLQSSQPQKSTSQPGRMGDPNVSAPVAKAIAETAAIAAASEADSSEACLTKEQKLKAERLKRAKMFAAMIKTGAAPMKTEPLRGLSAEPPASGISGSGADFENLVGKEREGSSVPMDVDTSDKTEKSDKRSSVDEYNERRSKRSYRSRSKRNEQEEEEEKKETEEEYKRAHKHSRKKHRSQRSSRHDRDRHKHRKRHSSSEDTDSQHVHNYDDSLDDGHRRSSHRHKHDVPSEDERRPAKHHRKHASSSDNEHRLSRRRRKHHSSSSDDEHEHRSRSVRYRKSQPEEVDLEEGEILAKSDQSQASQGKGASREASVEVSKSYRDGSTAPSRTSETTEVPDDLRAKIRAMLMATL